MFYKLLFFNLGLSVGQLFASQYDNNIERYKQLALIEEKMSESNKKDVHFQPRVPKKTFKDLIGNAPDEIEDIVFEVKLNLKKDKAIRSYKIILYGPPGGGKTMLAEAMAGELGWDLYSVSAGDLLTKYQGSANEKITGLLNTIIDSKKPSVLFIDEIDGLAHEDHADKSSELKRAVHALHKIDDIEKDFICIFATNAIDKLPTSLLSRFAENQIHIPLPNLEKRKLLLQNALEGYEYDKTDFASLVNMTQGFDCRELQFLSHKIVRVGEYLISKNDLKNIQNLLTSDAFFIAFYMIKKESQLGLRDTKIVLNYWLRRYTPNLSEDEMQVILSNQSLINVVQDMTTDEIKSGIEQANSLVCEKGELVPSVQDLLVGMHYLNTRMLPPEAMRMIILEYFFLIAGLEMPKDIIKTLAQHTNGEYTGQDLHELTSITKHLLANNHYNSYKCLCAYKALGELFERKMKLYQVYKTFGWYYNNNDTKHYHKCVTEKKLLSDLSQYVPINVTDQNTRTISHLEYCTLNQPNLKLQIALISLFLEEEGMSVEESMELIKKSELFFSIVDILCCSYTGLKKVVKNACNIAKNHNDNVCKWEYLKLSLLEIGLIVDGYDYCTSKINCEECCEEHALEKEAKKPKKPAPKPASKSKGWFFGLE